MQITALAHAKGEENKDKQTYPIIFVQIKSLLVLPKKSSLVFLNFNRFIYFFEGIDLYISMTF